MLVLSKDDKIPDMILDLERKTAPGDHTIFHVRLLKISTSRLSSVFPPRSLEAMR